MKKSPNAKKVILDLCGGTGSWSKPYRDAGYEVFNLTLPDFDIRNIKIYDGFLECAHTKTLYGFPVRVRVEIKNIHGILAAPPCTMFSIARSQTAKKPRDFAEGMELVRVCLELIWTVRAHPSSALKWWALENPTGYLRQFLGVPPLRFEQWQYGDDAIKPTDIWGYYEMPKKTCRARSMLVASHRDRKLYYRYGHRKAAEIFAMTPPGFARAFFKANK